MCRRSRRCFMGASRDTTPSGAGAGMNRETIHALRAAYQAYHTHRTMPRVLEAIAKNCPDAPEVREIVEFFKSTKRGIQPSVKFLNYLHQGSGADE